MTRKELENDYRVQLIKYIGAKDKRDALMKGYDQAHHLCEQHNRKNDCNAMKSIEKELVYKIMPKENDERNKLEKIMKELEK